MLKIKQFLDEYMQFLKCNINFDKSWAISDEQINFLYNLIKVQKPRSVLELGTGYGFSSLIILLALNSENSFTSVEIDKDRLNYLSNFISQKMIKKSIYLINQDILDFLSKNNSHTKYDLIFIDALQKDAKKIFAILEKKDFLLKNTIIIFDNLYTHTGVYELFNMINKKENFLSYKLDIGSGFLYIQKE